MATTQLSPFPFPPKRVYMGANIPMRLIRRYVRAIAEEFHPDKIILFGSYAYGKPHEDSDVDLLVVMQVRDQHAQAVRIRWRLAAPFPVHLLIRTPKDIAWRLAEGESFMTTIVSQGKVLYEKDDEEVGGESKVPVHDGVCFHCQQCAEKYLKALMEELGLPVPKTHDLDLLLRALLPHHPTLRSLRRGLLFLSDLPWTRAIPAPTPASV
jgi:uncharacterized protein